MGTLTKKLLDMFPTMYLEEKNPLEEESDDMLRHHSMRDFHPNPKYLG